VNTTFLVVWSDLTHESNLILPTKCESDALTTTVNASMHWLIFQLESIFKRLQYYAANSVQLMKKNCRQKFGMPNFICTILSKMPWLWINCHFQLCLQYTMQFKRDGVKAI